ncbi:fungal zn(2)-Cys(6) binuclear cluster domain-containing protein [Rhizoctonia solani AG-1 IA]|uniref:Fungal zn(2)-Cys(6) binuclear cluster domain-containing protein n=1 Tax=Thanatephorus cucumeris (strain AG1-IA) TaxID=983506 RepID=L8WQ16_THACA|nr:fungal zn(2)-Cys(6) binuclear cluster domain-containing protein [Rhizoctonia solani AG-1 IA]
MSTLPSRPSPETYCRKPPRRKKCDERRPICSRCTKADSECIWPSEYRVFDPQVESFPSDYGATNGFPQPISNPAGLNTSIFLVPQFEKHQFSSQQMSTMDTGLGMSNLELIWNELEELSLTNYSDATSKSPADEPGSIDHGTLVVNSKLLEYARDYGPKVVWPPAADAFDPEGIMPLVQQSAGVPRIIDDPIFQDVRDFFEKFLTRFFYNYATIHENLHVRIRRRFGASMSLKYGMLGMAALFRSNYEHSVVPTSMQKSTKELHRLTSRMIQLELENDAISPWIKLAGLWELLNYEYFDGILSSYYAHLNQAASIVRLALGSNTIDILKLSGEQTFDLRCIAWADILSSMALARPTLLNYESDIHNQPQYDNSGDPDKGVEWVFGCPDILAILMARTSALRHACISFEEKVECGHEIQQLVCDWKFRPVPAQRSALRVARVASQEIWRHAAILYIHQSILKSDSSNPVVRNSVKLIIQIASTLIPGAGSFATIQKDRYTLRSRILTSGNEGFLRHLVVALDDLWKETDAKGRLTTWSERYPAKQLMMQVTSVVESHAAWLPRTISTELLFLSTYHMIPVSRAPIKSVCVFLFNPNANMPGCSLGCKITHSPQSIAHTNNSDLQVNPHVIRLAAYQPTGYLVALMSRMETGVDPCGSYFWSIRPISPRDIPDIYHICLLTGDAGQSAEGLHQYPELIGLIYGEPYFVVAPSTKTRMGIKVDGERGRSPTEELSPDEIHRFIQAAGRWYLTEPSVTRCVPTVALCRSERKPRNGMWALITTTPVVPDYPVVTCLLNCIHRPLIKLIDVTLN